MNDNTIRALYLGKIRPEKSNGYKTEKYTKNLEEFNRLYDLVEAALPKESRRLLDTMIEEYNESQGEIIIDTFAQGFKIGLRLAAEGLPEARSK
ncbi:MAG: hypothetical protein K2J77_11340 [Oscillospiraceae bacterium]|nr:hypothetical protein [Oscillospiraceae bacterium]